MKRCFMMLIRVKSMNSGKKTVQTEKIILGIDPGTTIMGFGLIKIVGKKMHFLQLNELQLQKYKDHYLKLKLIFERTIELIDTYNPDEIAVSRWQQVYHAKCPSQNILLKK